MNGRISGVLAMAMVVSAVLMAGCGGGEDTADATVKLTKAEFIKQADAICEEAFEQREDRVAEIAEENGFSFENINKKHLEQLATEAVIPTLNRQVEDLNALGLPEGDEEQAREVIVSLENVRDEFEDNPGLAGEGKPLEEPSKLAKAFGFKVCAQE